MKLRQYFSQLGRRMTYGKHGFDDLSRFLAAASLLPFLSSLVLVRVARGIPSTVLYLIGMTVVIWSVWRAFSSDLAARRRENDHFVSGKFYRSLRDAAQRFSQRKDFCFFLCPGCKRWLRVPRGRGKIEITCPSCKTKFRKST